MKVISRIIELAKKDKKTIILPESEDIRVLEAAKLAANNDIANIIVIGNYKVIEKKCIENNMDFPFDKIEIVNPITFERRKEYEDKLYDIRKEKGMTEKQAHKLMDNYIYFGVMMIKMGDADGLVSGACHSSADTLRPALQIIKTSENAKIVSAFFMMELENSSYKDAYIFADSGLVEFPNDEERAEIAIESSESCKLLLGEEPCIAMISYSTKGSAKSESIDSVNRSLEIVKTRRPDIKIDGELQVDAAIDKEVAKLKCPQSTVAGNANVFVFPDLNAGNIGYKLVQRFGHAKAYGPITQGLAAPINDLSRGCTAEDILGVIAITSVQAGNN